MSPGSGSPTPPLLREGWPRPSPAWASARTRPGESPGETAREPDFPESQVG